MALGKLWYGSPYTHLLKGDCRFGDLVAAALKAPSFLYPYNPSFSMCIEAADTHGQLQGRRSISASFAEG